MIDCERDKQKNKLQKWQEYFKGRMYEAESVDYSGLVPTTIHLTGCELREITEVLSVAKGEI